MAIYDYCDDLTDFPLRGCARDDLAPGLRVLGFRKRAAIAFTIIESEVTIHGIYYGGRDYETNIRDKFEDNETDSPN